MIKKIIAGAFLLCLLIAIPLVTMGITRVDLSAGFLALLKNTSRELNNFKVAIPDIPKIPALENVNGFMVVVDVLVKFINGFVNLLNFVVTMVNYAIEVIQFLVILVKNIITFRQSLTQQLDNFPYIT